MTIEAAPEHPFARLFDRLAEQYEGEEEGVELPSLFSSHPATQRRAEIARSRSRVGLAPSLTDAEWRIVQSSCGMIIEDEAAPESPTTEASPAEESKPPELEGGDKPD